MNIKVKIQTKEQNSTSIEIQVPAEKKLLFIRKCIEAAEMMQSDQFQKKERTDEITKEFPDAPAQNIHSDNIAEKPVYTQKEQVQQDLPEVQQEEKYRGFLHIRCEKCGEVHTYCAKTPTSSNACDKCGTRTPLKGLKPIYMECSCCGSVFKYKTNMNTAELEMNCLQCKAPVDLKMNGRRNAYVTKKMSGGNYEKI